MQYTFIAYSLKDYTCKVFRKSTNDIKIIILLQIITCDMLHFDLIWSASNPRQNITNINNQRDKSLLLEAQLLYNYIDVTDSLPHLLTHSRGVSYFVHIFVVCWSIWTFFTVFQTPVSLGGRGRGWILSDFRDLSFCGPCGHFFK